MLDDLTMDRTPTLPRFVPVHVVGAMAGAFAFWGSYGLVRYVTGASYGGKSVGLLTLLAPLVTSMVTLAWYHKVPVGRRLSIMPAISIGVIGPMMATWVYGLFVITIPAARMAPRVSIVDYLSFAVLSVTLGPLSVLTYTGMLGAAALNTVCSPLLGLWLSKKFERQRGPRGAREDGDRPR